MGRRMNGHLLDSPLLGEISVDGIIAVAKSTDQPAVLIEFVQFLFRNPLITEKQFYLGFIRILLTPQKERHGDRPSVISYSKLAAHRIRGVCPSSIRVLVDVLLAAANEKMRKTNVEVRQVVRDYDGRPMVAVVTAMMHTAEIRKGSTLSDLELALIFEWVHAMYADDGKGHISTAHVFATADSFRLSGERTLEILNFLCYHQYFDQTTTGFMIAYRGMEELDPVVTGKFRLKMCSECNQLVVMTQHSRVDDKMVHAGCAKNNHCNNNFAMIHYPLRIFGCEKIAQQKNRDRRNRGHQMKRAKIADIFEVTSEDEEDFLNEFWSDGEEADYEPSEIERICLEEAGIEY